jgi:hypothetical protein
MEHLAPRREGDWDCPNCGGLVFASNPECFKCRTPKPSGMGGSGGADRRWQEVGGGSDRYGHRDPGYSDRGGMLSRTQDQNSRELPARDTQQRYMQQTWDRGAWDPKGADHAMQVLHVPLERHRHACIHTHARTTQHSQHKRAHGRVPSFSDKHAPTHEPINAHSARTPHLARNVTIGTSPATRAPPLQGCTAPPFQGWKESKGQKKAGGVMVFFSSTRAGQAGAGAGTWRPEWRSPILKSPVHSD